LKRLRQQDYPWDKYTCTFATEAGHFEILEWAHQQGCPWDSETTDAALSNHHIEIFKWAIENGCPVNCNSCTLLLCTNPPQLEAIQWVKDNGYDGKGEK